MFIEDGQGKGNIAAVNNDNQLITRAASVEQRLVSALDDNYYEATTGKVTLADADETGIIYVKNTGTTDIVVDRVFYDIWEPSGGSVSGTLKYYINPEITGGSTITPNNTNFGSTNMLDATALKSLTTFSGTVMWTAQFLAPTSVALEEGRIVLRAGNSIAITVEAPSGNVSMDVAVNVAMYNFDSTLIGS